MAINNNIIPGFDEEKDDSLKISLDKVSDLPNCIRIYLNGYIDTYNSNFFQKKIAKVIVTVAEKWEKFCFSLGIFRVFQCFNVFFCAFNTCFITN